MQKETATKASARMTAVKESVCIDGHAAAAQWRDSCMQVSLRLASSMDWASNGTPMAKSGTAVDGRLASS